VQTAYAQRYRTLWDHHWWWRSRERLLLATISDLARRNAIQRVLDIGCGDGLFFDALESFGEVHGREPDVSLLSESRWRERIHQASLGPDFQVDVPFDLTLMLDVLEHIGDDADALLEARSVLRPGGLILLTVPALPWLWSQHDEANLHHRRYTPELLRNVLERAGFEVESIRFYFAWTVGPMLVRRFLAPSGEGTSDYEVGIPPGPINRLLTAYTSLEHAVGRRVRWPIGSSLLAIARRPQIGGVD
jgi:SAM-dependent methyltransferase